MSKEVVILIPESAEELTSGIDKFMESLRIVGDLIRGIESVLDRMAAHFTPKLVTELTLGDLHFFVIRQKRMHLYCKRAETIYGSAKSFVKLSDAEFFSKIYEALKDPQNIQELYLGFKSKKDTIFAEFNFPMK